MLLKAAVILFCGLIFGGALVAMVSIGSHDRPNDAYYNSSNNTINLTQDVAEQVTATGANLTPMLVALGGIVFLFVAFMALRKSAGGR